MVGLVSIVGSLFFSRDCSILFELSENYLFSHVEKFDTRVLCFKFVYIYIYLLLNSFNG